MKKIYVFFSIITILIKASEIEIIIGNKKLNNEDLVKISDNQKHELKKISNPVCMDRLVGMSYTILSPEDGRKLREMQEQLPVDLTWKEKEESFNDYTNRLHPNSIVCSLTCLPTVCSWAFSGLAGCGSICWPACGGIAKAAALYAATPITVSTLTLWTSFEIALCATYRYCVNIKDQKISDTTI